MGKFGVKPFCQDALYQQLTQQHLQECVAISRADAAHWGSTLRNSECSGAVLHDAGGLAWRPFQHQCHSASGRSHVHLAATAGPAPGSIGSCFPLSTSCLLDPAKVKALLALGTAGSLRQSEGQVKQMLKHDLALADSGVCSMQTCFKQAACARRSRGAGLRAAVPCGDVQHQGGQIAWPRLTALWSAAFIPSVRALDHRKDVASNSAEDMFLFCVRSYYPVRQELCHEHGMRSERS